MSDEGLQDRSDEDVAPAEGLKRFRLPSLPFLVTVALLAAYIFIAMGDAPPRHVITSAPGPFSAAIESKTSPNVEIQFVSLRIEYGSASLDTLSDLVWFSVILESSEQIQTAVFFEYPTIVRPTAYKLTRQESLSTHPPPASVSVSEKAVNGRFRPASGVEIRGSNYPSDHRVVRIPVKAEPGIYTLSLYLEGGVALLESYYKVGRGKRQYRAELQREMLDIPTHFPEATRLATRSNAAAMMEISTIMFGGYTVSQPIPDPVRFQHYGVDWHSPLIGPPAWDQSFAVEMTATNEEERFLLARMSDMVILVLGVVLGVMAERRSASPRRRGKPAGGRRSSN